jgi:putative heme iron utilization protein
MDVNGKTKGGAAGEGKQPPQIKATDSHRQAVRRLIRTGRSGALGTLAAGVPLVSLVTYGTDYDGSPLFLLSTLAEHTQSLLINPQCSFLIERASQLDNPQTGERVTLCGRMEKVRDPAHLATARARFLSQNPAAARYADFGDFALWRLVIERAHFVGGFARAVWIEDGLLVDPSLAADLAQAVPGILDHMNADHADAVAHYAAAFLPVEDQHEAPWRLVSLDSDGFRLVPSEAERSYVVLFDHPLISVEDCRPTLVALAKKARQVVTDMAFARC